MQFRKGMIATLVLIGLCHGGIAQATSGKPIVKAQTKDDFATVAAAVRKEMVPGGRFEFMDNKERDTVNQRLDEMGTLFDSFGNVDKMNQDAKIKLYNDQEQVNAILRNRDGNRRVCESVRHVGSLIPQSHCMTYREKQLEIRGTQQYFDENRRSNPQLTNGAGSH